MGVALALLIATVICPVCYLAMYRVAESARRINHARQVLTKLSEVPSVMQNVETYAQGFLSRAINAFWIRMNPLMRASAKTWWNCRR